LRNEENPQPKTFKALRYETSVWKYFVELKENSLTSKGYFDLVNVPDLYVIGAGRFLRNLRVNNDLRQKDIAEIVNVAHSQVSQWEKDIYRMPLKSLVKITERFKLSRDAIYEAIDKRMITTKTNLPVKFERIRDIIKFLFPSSLPRSSHVWNVILLKCPDKTLRKIKCVFNLNIHIESRRTVVSSKELHTFLTTFFRYTKVLKIRPPLTNEVKHWSEHYIDLKRAIICPCLQTDGSIGQQKSRIRFFGKNKRLHDYFVDAIYYEYNLLPTSYFKLTIDDKTEYTTYKNKPEIVDDVMKLAGNSKTAPAHGQSIDEYLKEPQPHLKYLKNASKTEQQIALRIWASTEGYIQIERIKHCLRPCLGISCAHPDLVKQLRQLAWNFEIHFTIQKDAKKTWSGITKLVATSMKSILNFLKLGGFIKGIKISSKSPYHEGIDKSTLLLGILEFKKREKKDRLLRKLSIKKIHSKINEIINNKEYRNESYYIKHLS